MNRAMLLLPVLLLSGCPKLGEILNALDIEQYRPTVSFERMELRGIDFDGADLDFVFKVDNPSPADVKLASFDWDLDVAGGDFLAGARPDGMSLGAQASSELVLPVRMGFQKLIKAGQELKGKDEIPYTLSINSGFETPLGVVTVPASRSGTAPVLSRPQVTLKAARVASLQLLQNKANLELDLGLTNDQASPVGLAGLDWRVKLEGKQVATGAASKLPELQPGKESVVTLPIAVNLLELGSSVASAIKDRSKVGVGLDADLVVRTPWGEAPLAVERARQLKLQ